MIKTITENTVYTHEVKKSRFIAQVGPADSKRAFKDALARSREAYPDAGHHCWAYLFGGSSSENAGMGDDGEPSGTAGKPILNVLQHSGCCNLVAVVARYFGGTKLGAGGLVRAYSAATQKALDSLAKVELQPKVQLMIKGNFQFESDIRHLVTRFEGEILSFEYGREFSTLVLVNEVQLIEFKDKLNDKFKGLVICEEI